MYIKMCVHIQSSLGIYIYVYIQCIHCMNLKYLTAETLHGSSSSEMYECVLIDLLILS
jgi:hypothetical protein